MRVDQIHTFCKWLNESGFPFHEGTNEATIQNQLGLYLNFWLPRSSRVELEVNVNKLLGTGKRLTKKEADLVVTGSGIQSAIEVKFWKDAGTYNIGMYRCYEDIAFLEDLVRSGFSNSFMFFLTNIPQHYERASRKPKPRNIENLQLYETFRERQVLEGEVRIKTGNLDQTVAIRQKYLLDWRFLQKDVWYTVLEVSAEQQ